VVAVENAAAKQADILIVRDPGQDDRILIKRQAVTAPNVARAIRQLELVRSVEGDAPKRSAMYRVTSSASNRRPAPGGAGADVQQARGEEEFGETIASALRQAPAGSRRYKHAQFGEGPFLTVAVPRPKKGS